MLARVLIIYTGGTFGMDLGNGKEPLSVPRLSKDLLEKRLRDRVPELAGLADCDIEILLNRDSAHIGPDDWLMLARHIKSRWKKYDGIVVLHGTDTLSYTAAALSFLLRPCPKPIVLTGAQKPLASIRTDARRNLISAVEIAASGRRKSLQQVTLFFDDRLLQGNRARKRSSTEFFAFDSPKCQPLARVGTSIHFSAADPSIRLGKAPLKMQDAFSRKVALLQLTPGFPAEAVEKGLLPQVEALVLVVFASGTATTHDPAFLSLLRKAKETGKPVVGVTDDVSLAGGQGGRKSGGTPVATYEAGKALLEEGCYWADQMTAESAYVKTCFVLGQADGAKQFGKYWRRNFAGEMG
jgi:L-asparaginase